MNGGRHLRHDVSLTPQTLPRTACACLLCFSEGFSSIVKEPAPSDPRIRRERQVYEVFDKVIVELGSSSVQGMHVYSSTVIDESTFEMDKTRVLFLPSPRSIESVGSTLKTPREGVARVTDSRAVA